MLLFHFPIDKLKAIRQVSACKTEQELYLSQFMRLWYISQATSEGSGELVHLRSLARAFAIATHELWK